MVSILAACRNFVIVKRRVLACYFSLATANFSMYMMCRKHGEDDVTVADAGDTGLVLPIIPSHHVLLLQNSRPNFFSMR